ncbi:MAG: hypothetical protein JNL90_17095 [Planctomycetes bacterium]|nr:hypothetical protein [Planctomycetota bacterium]
MGRPAGLLVVGVLFGAIVGGCVGFLVWGADGARPVADARERASSTRAAPFEERSATSVAEPAAIAAERSEAMHGDRSAAPASVLDDAVEFARQAPPPASSRGTKTIRGRIVDRDGRPVVGAVVRALREVEATRMPSASSLGESAPAAARLEDAVKRAVEAFYDRAADRRETQSDANGEYALTELRDGHWRVQAWQTGFSLTALPSDEVRPDATVDFTATPVVPCAIDVALPDGTIPSAALLSIRRPGAERWSREELWSRERPRVALAVGEWELRATLGDPQSGPSWPAYLASKPARVVAEAERTAGPIALRLEGTPGIRGTIVNRRGGDRHVMVKLLALARGAEPDLKLLARSDGSHHWSTDGSYAFTDLAPGRYVVGVSGNWQDRIRAHAVVEVGAGMVVQDLEIPPLERANCIVARVLDPAGRAVDDVRFVLEVATSRGSSGSHVEAERRADGSWWIPLEGSDELFQDDGSLVADATLSVTAKSESFGDATAKVAASGPREVELRFGAAASLVATIAGYAGSGFEGRLSLSVRAIEEEEEGRHFFRMTGETVRPDGTQEFGALAPGRYRLELTLQDGSSRFGGDNSLGHLDLTLTAGENRATVVIPTLHSLTVLVPDGATGQVELRRITGEGEEEEVDWSGWHQLEIDAQGRAVFKELLAGKYSVSIDFDDLDVSGALDELGYGDDSSGELEVTVPAATGAVRFKPAVLNALVVWVQDEEGQLARAGFERGDLLVAVDGERFEKASAMKEAIAARLAKKSITFTVVRGGETLELVVESSVFTNPFGLGGVFNEASH